MLGSVVKSSVESFEISNDNSLRSVKVLYSNDRGLIKISDRKAYGLAVGHINGKGIKSKNT